MSQIRANISFWITVISFVGSILFVANMVLFDGYRSPECEQCVEKMLYYQHRADSLQLNITSETSDSSASK